MDIEIEISEAKCPKCGEMFEKQSLVSLGRVILATEHCDACATMAAEALETLERVEIAERIRNRRGEAYNSICPPLYRNSDEKRLHSEFVKSAKTWNLSSESGLAFIGDAGTGKTRAMFILCKRFIDAEITVDAISATQFAKLCSDQFSDDSDKKRKATNRMEKLHRMQIIFIDDLGKQRMTDRVEQEFYDLLEHRTSSILPTLWTSNASSQELEAMMSNDRAEPIMRRLIDFSTIITKTDRII